MSNLSSLLLLLLLLQTKGAQKASEGDRVKAEYLCCCCHSHGHCVSLTVRGLVVIYPSRVFQEDQSIKSRLLQH